MIPRNKLPSQERLRELFDYDPETGQLKWKRTKQIAGTPNIRKYRNVKLDYTSYYAHRIIWKWMTGEEPPIEIDHIDANKANNKWNNLRSATRQQNACNFVGSENKGVCYDPYQDKWRAYIRVDGKVTTIGRFKTRGEAQMARVATAKAVYGEFAREFDA